MTTAIVPSSPATLAPVAPDDTRARWAALAEDWIATRKSDRTRRAYTYALARFFADVDADPWQVTRADVARYGAGLRAAGRSDATIAARLAAVSAFYQHARAEGLTDRNPAEGVPRPTVEPYGHAAPLTRDQAAAVLRGPDRATVAGRRDYAMLLLQFTTGIRRAELVNIHRGDLAETPAGDWLLTYRPKGGNQVTRPLPRRAVPALLAVLADRGELDPDAPVFVAADRGAYRRSARPLTAEAWRCIVTKYTAAALGFRVHPHALRHTVASLAWEKTHDLKEVQALLGHKHATTTQRYITRLEDNRATLGDDLAALLGV